MDAIEREAMFIRHEIATDLLRKREIEGIDALAFILIPPRAARDESLRQARENGPRPSALNPVRVDDEASPTRSEPHPSPSTTRPPSGSLTIDQLLAVAARKQRRGGHVRRARART